MVQFHQTELKRSTLIIHRLHQLNNIMLIMGDCASRNNQDDAQIEDALRNQEAMMQLGIQEAKTNNKGKRKQPMTEDQLYQLVCEYFDSFDVDHDDSLSFEEVLKMLKQMETNFNKHRKYKIEIDMNEAK